MFQLDDNFLNELGLGDMPAEQKRPFLQHIYEELEVRVGTELSQGLSDEQLAEFESIINFKEEAINTWLAKNSPDYQTDQEYVKLQTSEDTESSDPALRAEYAATKWLQINRPDYHDVVAKTLSNLKQEIAANRSKILGA